MSSEARSKWNPVKKIMGNPKVHLGRHLSYWWENTPRSALYFMSHYKFAAKMIGVDKRVLDVGCAEGLGTWLLALECGHAKGIDIDMQAIDIGKKNWRDPRISFECNDHIFKMKQDQYDAVVSFDVIEHIIPKNVDTFMRLIVDRLSENGVSIIGTPSLTGQTYASEVSKAGHVNVYSAERLEEEMLQYFEHVFLFCANDEVIHTGYTQMAHYYIAMGCKKRSNY
ncbi:MAG: class I SAM-dependent methyltransferase [Candidatus Scalindua sp.]|jgi:2-polyprenyl-3-methyl-5-hydroxy-6-metoxy-1,4-benzoquinol methylase|nr:class I SAM-dependent methyltransferase [Candidatus Scalindua sp.]